MKKDYKGLFKAAATSKEKMALLLELVKSPDATIDDVPKEAVERWWGKDFLAQDKDQSDFNELKEMLSYSVGEKIAAKTALGNIGSFKCLQALIAAGADLQTETPDKKDALLGVLSGIQENSQELGDMRLWEIYITNCCLTNRKIQNRLKADFSYRDAVLKQVNALNNQMLLKSFRKYQSKDYKGLFNAAPTSKDKMAVLLDLVKFSIDENDIPEKAVELWWGNDFLAKDKDESDFNQLKAMLSYPLGENIAKQTALGNIGSFKYLQVLMEAGADLQTEIQDKKDALLGVLSGIQENRQELSDISMWETCIPYCYLTYPKIQTRLKTDSKYRDEVLEAVKALKSDKLLDCMKEYQPKEQSVPSQVSPNQETVELPSKETIEQIFKEAVKDKDLKGLEEIAKVCGNTKEFIDQIKIYGPDTPLSYAIRKGAREVVKYLLDNGAKVDRGVFYDAFRHYESTSDISMLQALLEYQSVKDLINTKDDQGQRPIHGACLVSWPVVDLLYKNGADLLATGVDEQNIFHFAALNRWGDNGPGIIRYLMGLGRGDINQLLDSKSKPVRKNGFGSFELPGETPFEKVSRIVKDFKDVKLEGSMEALVEAKKKLKSKELSKAKDGSQSLYSMASSAFSLAKKELSVITNSFGFRQSSANPVSSEAMQTGVVSLNEASNNENELGDLEKRMPRVL